MSSEQNDNNGVRFIGGRSQIKLQKPQSQVNMATNFSGKLVVAEQQVDAHGYPYLCCDGIPGSTQKCLDLKALFDPFEKTTIPVNDTCRVGHDIDYQVEIVS